MPKFHEAGVYMIRNSRAGDAYIGASCCLTQRLNQHRDAMVSGMWYAGGWRNEIQLHEWEFSIIERVEVPASEPKRGGGPGVRHLLSREKHWIKTLRPSFNRQPRSPMSIKDLQVGTPVNLAATG